MPLEALARWTERHREERAAEHEKEARTAAARALESWDAIGRTRPAHLDTALDWKAAKGRRPRRPVWDSRTHIRRTRRKRRDYRDGKGRARRAWTAVRVEVPAHEAHEASRKWHEGRAMGQRTRLATAAHCGQGVVVVSCNCCGVVTEAPVWCGIVRLCEGCNIRRSMRMRARFATSLRVALYHAEIAGSLRRDRPGGALGQHHVVLTAPHVEVMGEVWEGGASIDRKATAKERIRLVFAAWKRLSARLQAWMREPWEGLSQTVGAAWHRAFEWTTGADGCGHPHFHLWTLTPWLPEHDDHRVASIVDGKPRASMRCLAPRRLAGAWGWAETMRRERCPGCVQLPQDRAAGLDAYYRAPGARAWTTPPVERRTGLRTWWADALAAEGAPVDEQRVNVTVRKAYARPQELIREVQKPNGIVYRDRKVRRIEIVDGSGALLDYFESWCLAFVDQETWELAGPDVISGVYEALEGRRLSQSSKTLLRRRDGSVKSVGFLGIADSFVDGSCRDCNDAAAVRGLPPPPIVERRVDVVTWDRAAQFQDDVKWPRGPPPEDPHHVTIFSPGDEYAALVAKLRQAEPEAMARATSSMARLGAATTSIRSDPSLLLPSYRRGGAPKGQRRGRGLRDRMRALADRAR